MRWCCDKRVLIGLGLATVALLALYPQWAAVALPVLVVAACPLSMLLMMRMMNGNGQPATGTRSQATYDTQAELAQLREEINILKARHAHPNASPTSSGEVG